MSTIAKETIREALALMLASGGDVTTCMALSGISKTVWLYEYVLTFVGMEIELSDRLMHILHIYIIYYPIARS